MKRNSLMIVKFGLVSTHWEGKEEGRGKYV